MSLAELLDDLPDVAVHTLGRDVSRDELAGSAEQLGTLLGDTGLATGQVVAAMLPNDATTIAALFGTWRAGGVYTPLNPRAADAELVSQLETLRPVAVITTLISHTASSASRPARRDGRRPDVVRHACVASAERIRASTTPTSHCCSSPPEPPGLPSRCHFATPPCSTSSTDCWPSSAARNRVQPSRAGRQCLIWCRCPCRCGPGSTRCCSRSARAPASC